MPKGKRGFPFSRETTPEVLTQMVCFYISGHGFGHASREVEIINAFARRRPDVKIFVRSSASPALLQRTLRTPYTLWPAPSDTGVIQRSSLAQDERASLEAAWAFHRSLDERAQADAEILKRAGIRLVAADIPPLAFAAASLAGIPSVAISNFTWDWIYEPWIDPGSDLRALLDVIRHAYAQASHALLLPFGDGFDVFPSVQRIPLVARHATRARAGVRRRFNLPDDRPLALLSFGGFGLPALDLGSVDCLNEWTVVTLDRPAAGSTSSPRIVHLDAAEFFSSGVRYEDLVAAADVVISKPGYGIISECIAAGTALLYTSRGDFREYDLLVRDMPRYLRCGFITPADLLAGRWRAGLEGVRRQPPPPETMATDGAEVAAGILATMGSWP